MSKLIFHMFALAFCTMAIQAIEVRSLGKRVAFLEYRLNARQIDAAVEALGKAHKFSTDLVIEKMRVQAEAPASGPLNFGKYNEYMYNNIKTLRRRMTE